MSIEDFDQKAFIKSVREFMESHSLSCRTFAKISNVAAMTLYRLEAGQNEVTFATIRKLKRAMSSYTPASRPEADPAPSA